MEQIEELRLPKCALCQIKHFTKSPAYTVGIMPAREILLLLLLLLFKSSALSPSDNA